MQGSASAKTPPLTQRNPSPNLRKYIELLRDPTARIVVATGPAGVAKTFAAVVEGTAALKRQEFAKLILTKPMITVDEPLGALPGDAHAKVSPYLVHIIEMLKTAYDPQLLQLLLKREQIEITPVGILRGRTFMNSFVVVDEAQNATPAQLKMALTRIGEGSKMVVTGDITQTDLKPGVVSGLADFQGRLLAHGQLSDSIRSVQFGLEDVIRDPVVAEVLSIYSS